VTLSEGERKMLQLSWSGLRRHEDCKQRHLRVIQGKSSPLTDGRNFLPGTIADHIMRTWLESSNPQRGEMAAMVPEFFQRYAVDDPEYRINWRHARDKAQVRGFVYEVLKGLEPLLMEHVIPYEYAPELKFNTIIGMPFLDGRPVPVRLIGGIDIVVRKWVPEAPGSKTLIPQYIIWDLKATKNADYVRKVMGQLIFYDIAFGHWIGDSSQPRMAGLLMPAVKDKTAPSWSFTEDQRATMMSRIQAMCDSMWRREWEPKAKADSGCNICEVKWACDLFKVPTYRNESGKNVASFEAAAAARLSSRQKLA
jgi:hypothetical protein